MRYDWYDVLDKEEKECRGQYKVMPNVLEDKDFVNRIMDSVFNGEFKDPAICDVLTGMADVNFGLEIKRGMGW